MTNEQITALAREYAEERASIMQGSLTTKIQAELVIRFLLRRFCLVEKADVEAKYKEAKERYLNPDEEVEKTMYGGRMSLLEYLFPEITKEVEG